MIIEIKLEIITLKAFIYFINCHKKLNKYSHLVLALHKIQFLFNIKNTLVADYLILLP